jgi:hypothetical protein
VVFVPVGTVSFVFLGVGAFALFEPDGSGFLVTLVFFVFLSETCSGPAELEEEG